MKCVRCRREHDTDASRCPNCGGTPAREFDAELVLRATLGRADG
ncbi:hypothetical protein [Haloarchaeobius sp. HME9146]|nr:hypothetical protein [Haloarchaeobius sp. HME9146]MCT9095296.1 hypothetical protein [Haloarchaeobius sp. HME9146]